MNEPQQWAQYKRILAAMMSYRDGMDYDFNFEFSQEQLGELQPEDIYKWMAFKVYGRPDPNGDDNPTLGRSTSLQYYKKALSYFMPNKLASWNSLIRCGNPTRSIPVIELIKAVKKKEVRKQGKKSAAVRPLELDEFTNTITCLRSCSDGVRRYQMPALCTFQFQMVGRIDDCCQLKKEDVLPCVRFPFALIYQLCWSKNVKEEREAPKQILLGAISPLYCACSSFHVDPS